MALSPNRLHSDPLTAIITPAEVQSGLPGDSLTLSVVVQNQGHQSAVIDVFLDATAAIPRQWCRTPRQRIALDRHQSSEVVFELELPSNALPGTYDYTLVLDAPDHYPEETPIQYPQQLRVLLPAQTAVRVNDPTFFLHPATNPQKPAPLTPGDILPVEVRVENRSQRVDRFRLVCLDVESDWFTIRYPTPHRNALGLVADADSLELNPGDQGTIRLEVHPPPTLVAGVYAPTFRLYSANQPDLVLLDLLYLDVRAVDTLNVNWDTILDRVSHRPGQYQLQLANRGNVMRQLSFSARSRDEEEWCTYEYQPAELRLAPGREAQVQLQVTPIRRWRRPWFGGGRSIPFQVQIQDTQGYRVPEPQPRGTLIWKARPWWQLGLVGLLGLTLLGSTAALLGFIILRPPRPLTIEGLRPVSATYIEGDSVQLQWQIRNPKRLRQLQLTAQVQDAQPLPPQTLDFDRGQPIADPPDTCPEPELLCQQQRIGKLSAGQYQFSLQALPRSGSAPEPARLTVTIAAKPDPQISRFQSAQTEYRSGSTVPLQWTIEHVGQLARLTLTATHTASGRVTSREYAFTSGISKDLQSHCTRTGETLTCTDVPLAGLPAGPHTVQLTGTSVKGKTIVAPAPAALTLQPRPLKIEFFRINNQQSGNVRVIVNQPLTLRWRVTGGEGNVTVEITPYGSVPPSGTLSPGGLATAGDRQIQISASDEAGQRITGPGFVVTVVAPPSPAPLPLPSPRPRLLRLPRS